MNKYTVLFFGERYFSYSGSFDSYIYNLFSTLTQLHETLEVIFFGESRFDLYILCLLDRFGFQNIQKTLILAYQTPEYIYAKDRLYKIFNNVEFCSTIGRNDPILNRNRYAIDKSDRVICFVQTDDMLKQTLKYTHAKSVTNLAALF